MAIKIWTDFKTGDRVMASDCERDIGTVIETAPDATVAGRAFIRWDDNALPSWLRADMLTFSPHVEDETWEYMLDLLLSGETSPADFRSQMDCEGYHVQQINNAIDYNWEEIRLQMLSEPT